MTRSDIDSLRLRYLAACEAFQLHARRVAAASKGGEAPSTDELFAEQEALHELAKIRRDFLDSIAAVHPTD